jgi:hypothetical protein
MSDDITVLEEIDKLSNEELDVLFEKESKELIAKTLLSMTDEEVQILKL